MQHGLLMLLELSMLLMLVVCVLRLIRLGFLMRLVLLDVTNVIVITDDTGGGRNTFTPDCIDRVAFSNINNCTGTHRYC